SGRARQGGTELKQAYAGQDLGQNAAAHAIFSVINSPHSPVRGAALVIGTIVKSNSHVSYLCRVYGRLETEAVPGPEQYTFGTFVQMAPVDGSDVRLIGVVRDTLLLNPDYGNLGPRLSSDSE